MSSSSSQSKNISLKSCGVIRAEEGATTFFCLQKRELREEGLKREWGLNTEITVTIRK